MSSYRGVARCGIRRTRNIWFGLGQFSRRCREFIITRCSICHTRDRRLRLGFGQMACRCSEFIIARCSIGHTRDRRLRLGFRQMTRRFIECLLVAWFKYRSGWSFKFFFVRCLVYHVQRTHHRLERIQWFGRYLTLILGLVVSSLGP